MVGYTVYAYHSASVFYHYCRDDPMEVEAVHIMESGETVSGGEDNVVEGKYFTHEETFPKDMINIPVGKRPMLTRCAAAHSPRLAAQRGERFRVPQLTQRVVQKSHLRCSLGRDTLGDRSLRNGLYKYRTYGAPWGKTRSGTTAYAVGCTDIAPLVLRGEEMIPGGCRLRRGYTSAGPPVLWGKGMSSGGSHGHREVPVVLWGKLCHWGPKGSAIKKIIFFQSFFIGVFELIWGKFVILQNFSPYGFIYPSELQR